MDDLSLDEIWPSAEPEHDAEVLISALEHYSYCPRQCALIHVEQTFDENMFTIRGRLLHERADSGDKAAQRGVATWRGIPLWSERYGLRGKADVVELHDGVPYPVEYKAGRRQGIHTDIQLCAQALCLEEMLALDVPLGAIYYGAIRRRHEVHFDAVLRAKTLELVGAVRAMMRAKQLPGAPNDERCPACSLINACLPQVIGRRQQMGIWQRWLFEPLSE